MRWGDNAILGQENVACWQHIYIRKILDIACIWQHRGQTTDKVKAAVANGDTAIVMVPPGTTSKVQPLDVGVNSEFKNAVDRLATEPVAAKIHAFLNG